MQLATYLIAALLVLLAAFIIFRIYVRRIYLKYRRLTFTAALLESIIWGSIFCLPVSLQRFDLAKLLEQ